MSFYSRYRSSQMPVTIGLVVAIAGCFLLGWLGLRDFFANTMGLFPFKVASEPWTLLTYPFSSVGDGNAFISVLFLCLWLWGMGASVEHDLKPFRYLVFFMTVTLLSGLCFWLGSFFMKPAQLAQLYMVGAWVPVVGITVAWATRNPHQEILFMFVIRMKAMWVAWISVGILFFSTNVHVMAVFTMIPMALVYLYAADKLPLAYGAGRRGSSSQWSGRNRARSRKEQKAYYDDVRRREQQRDERERLRKLFENSLIDDPDDKDK